ncbi:hypothetical protein [Amycolatopsis thermoflava]|uniref:hypothetical protein n=1 Tax=Amycolatopsis thermoflava TaxID=84480 RepID=UPI00040C5FB5|nr:hypothetical protein [Amycolatopsis thermoflava]
MAKKDSTVAEDLRFQFDDPQVRHNGLVLESEVDGAGPVKFAARARRPSFVRPGRGLRRIDLQYWITAGVTLFAVALMSLTGRLADRVGTFKVAAIGLAGYAIVTYPAFLLMDIGNLGLAALGYVAIMVNMPSCRSPRSP